ncbi:DUF6193 family natural product biosynthesis protein [Kitasatospora sp. NPDC048538]|uniref:DUF6193 family natural product biosynthesis protein n=1 Tax=unclassified Kitasatospora TaxID=2633591 RepID=UPI0033F9CD86
MTDSGVGLDGDGNDGSDGNGGSVEVVEGCEGCENCEDDERDDGWLAELLERTAEGLGLRLPEPAGAWKRIVEYADAGTGRRVVVYQPEGEHPYQVRIQGHGAPLAGGLTADVAEVARATAAWTGGAGLAETGAAAPFVRYRDWALAHERERLGPVELEWRIKLDRVHTPPYDRHPRVHALVAAAYAQPVLRGLMPVHSHFNLWFSTAVERPWTDRTGYVLLPYEEGAYGSEEGAYGVHTGGELIARTETAEEAVALVVAALPEGLGPAR